MTKAAGASSKTATRGRPGDDPASDRYGAVDWTSVSAKKDPIACSPSCQIRLALGSMARFPDR